MDAMVMRRATAITILIKLPRRQRCDSDIIGCMSVHYGSLLEAVDASRSAMIDFTRELVAIPTETPPGAEYERCAGVIAKKVKEIGLEPQVVEVPASKPGERPG